MSEEMALQKYLGNSEEELLKVKLIQLRTEGMSAFDISQLKKIDQEFLQKIELSPGYIQRIVDMQRVKLLDHFDTWRTALIGKVADGNVAAMALFLSFMKDNQNQSVQTDGKNKQIEGRKVTDLSKVTDEQLQTEYREISDTG